MLRPRIEDLRDTLLDAFQAHDDRALAAQLTHRRFQLALIVAAALTSVLGALQAAVDVQWIGLTVTVVGLAASWVGKRQRSRAVLKEYLTERAKAEELRSLYFRYLAGLEDWDRRRLEEKVADIRHPLEPAPLEPPDAVQAGPPPGPAGTRDEATAQFLDAYDTHRLRGQYQWYGDRIAEYDRSARQTGRITEVLLFLAAVCGIVGSLWTSQTVALGFAAAVLGAIAAAVASWADVVGFAANAELYRAARSGLERLRPRRPDADAATSADVATYLDDVEDILLGEVRTWGEKWGQATDSAAGGHG